MTNLISEIQAILAKRAGQLCSSRYSHTESGVERHCLLGWMAVEAGIKLPGYEGNTEVIGMNGTEAFAQSLCDVYGMSTSMLRTLQFANDDTSTGSELAEHVQSIFDNWERSLSNTGR